MVIPAKVLVVVLPVRAPAVPVTLGATKAPVRLHAIVQDLALNPMHDMSTLSSHAIYANLQNSEIYTPTNFPMHVEAHTPL
jgi:hypothetical protein